MTVADVGLLNVISITPSLPMSALRPLWAHAMHWLPCYFSSVPVKVVPSADRMIWHNSVRGTNCTNINPAAAWSVIWRPPITGCADAVQLVP